jgi:beta-lactamase class A
MTQHRTRGAGASRRPRALMAAVLAGALIPVALAAAPASASTAKVVCTAKKPGLAAKLTQDIENALKGRKSVTAISFHDRRNGTTCTLRADQKFDSASVVKVTVLGALMLDAQKAKRSLTAREQQLAKAMITQSDNASTSTLWNQLGLTKVRSFLTATGMTQTVPGAGGYWGLTQITARDQQKLLDMLTIRGSVLTDASRAYVLKLMAEVVSSQRWGTPAGVLPGPAVQLKNGWLPRATLGWRVHSIGAFTGKGSDYSMVVLTHSNPGMNDGVNTIQAVARAIHANINHGATVIGPPRIPRAPAMSIPATPERPASGPVTAPVTTQR